jgi:hypothetical protein
MANDRDQERERRIKEMMRRRGNGKDPNEIGILSQGQAEILSFRFSTKTEAEMRRKSRII